MLVYKGMSLHTTISMHSVCAVISKLQLYKQIQAKGCTIHEAKQYPPMVVVQVLIHEQCWPNGGEGLFEPHVERDFGA